MSSLQCSKPPRRNPPAQQALFISRWISSSLTFACRSLWIPCRGQMIEAMPWRFPPAYLPCRGISFGFFSGWEESVRKRDVVDAHHPWIRRKLGIQIEEDRHIDLFFRL